MSFSMETFMKKFTWISLPDFAAMGRILYVVCENFGLLACKPSAIPIEPNTKLTTQQYDNETSSSEIDPPLKDPSHYQRLVGRLIYLTMTRLDICYVVHILSQFRHGPKQSHMDVATKELKYLKGCPGLGFLLPRDGNLDITAYHRICDLDGTCVQYEKIAPGFRVKLGGSLVSWKQRSN
ncbi:uncharacterized protein LOC116127098 [Pistacia vera]|uniref:uncharacterized protein LOC116127098 n=1 Tax=Pistacia vera TaxID=55513 RepID=UPI0012635ECE|nr:uncharacterized protein LOC116127098 [Pistacia vera]